MKKTWILLVISILCLGLFTACTSSADTMPSPIPSVSVSPSASPMASPSVSPTTSAGPTAGMEAGVNTIEDAARVSEMVEDEAEKLSEIDDAEAVVAGNIALVGVKYDAQYQGGLTERLIEMVDARVQAINKTITTVHVTDDATLMDKIKMLEEKVEKKEITFEELQTQVLDIGSKMAGGSDVNVNQPQSTAGA